MKKSRFTDSEIIEAIKPVEAGLAVPELCRDLGISLATFYKWRSKCRSSLKVETRHLCNQSLSEIWFIRFGRDGSLNLGADWVHHIAGSPMPVRLAYATTTVS